MGQLVKCGTVGRILPLIAQGDSVVWRLSGAEGDADIVCLILGAGRYRHDGGLLHVQWERALSCASVGWVEH